MAGQEVISFIIVSYGKNSRMEHFRLAAYGSQVTLHGGYRALQVPWQAGEDEMAVSSEVPATGNRQSQKSSRRAIMPMRRTNKCCEQIF